MKVFFKNMVMAYRGKCDGLVYYYNPRLNRMVARAHVKRRRTAQNDLFKAVSAQLKALAPAEGFKRDLATYVELYNRKAANFRHPLNNWYNAYTRMMWALAKKDPANIDLTTISRESIYEQGLQCISVKRAVEAGLLEAVKGWEGLAGEI